MTKQEPPQPTAERAAALLAMVEQRAIQSPMPEAVAQAVNLEQVVASLPSKDEQEVDAWIWTNEVLPRLKQSGLAERYWKRITEWSCVPQRKVYERCQAMCNRVGAIIVLTGKRGTGKTTIGAQMIISRAINPKLPPWEQQPPYRKLVDVIARYKPLYADFGSTQTDSLMAARDAFCRNSLVIIDEIHECEDQKLKARVLADIIDRRYSARRDTILISNQSEAEFKAATPDSVMSRLMEHGKIIPCEWQSFRTPTNP